MTRPDLRLPLADDEARARRGQWKMKILIKSGRMSLSRKKRTDNFEDALGIILGVLGNKRIDGVHFQPTAPEFKDVLSTTWRELERRCLVAREEDLVGGSTYQLTGTGWRTAIELYWDELKNVMEPAFSGVAKALKGAVKGRHKDAFVELSSVAAEAGLDENLVYNMIESEILDSMFDMHGAQWYEGQPPLIRVPLDFGLEPL